MKKLLLLISIVFFVNKIQAQQTCSTAITITTATTCNFTSHTTSGTEYWLKFVASSPTVNISLITTKFGVNTPHIHNLALLTGSCGNPTLIAEDELPFVNDAKELTIDLNASGLTIGQTYFIRAIRFATEVGRVCNKTGCTANGSTDPTTFNICVEDIDVFIPLDFGLEEPASNHSYVTNRGQLIDVNGNPTPEIKLYTINTNPQVYIADDKVSYVWSKINTDTTDTLHRVDMSLVGGNTTKVFKTEQTAGITNFYYGHTPSGVTGNKSYSRSVCNSVYTDIDMQFYSNESGVKYYFIVRPGGDADDIVMQFDGATAINVTASGGLEIVTSLGTLAFEAPHAYQINPAGNVVPMPWQAKFMSITANTVKFDIRNYPPKMPLIIQVDKGHAQKGVGDPEWSTFFGGSSDDFGYDITNDPSNGDIYVVGETASNNFPITFGASQPINGGSKDAFIAKFDDSYEKIWTTYYGGTRDEFGRGITYSTFDNKIYICGEVDALGGTGTFPLTTQSAGVTSYEDPDLSSACFIARFNPLNGSREWGTYFGGIQTFPTKITSDDVGNVYMVGYSTNFSFPSVGCGVPTNGAMPACDGTGLSYVQFQHNLGFSFGDGWIARFNPLTELTWSTFFGGNGDDIIHDIVIDNTNNLVYIVGSTESTAPATPSCNVSVDFPICGGVGSFLQPQLKGVSDGFIARFTSSNTIKYSTFYGGQGDDAITGAALNSLGQLYVTGYTNTPNTGSPLCVVPTTGFPFCQSPPPAYTQNFSGQFDAFISSFNGSDALVWSTFLGGDKDELFGTLLLNSFLHSAPKIIVNDNDDLIAVGNTFSGSSGSSVGFPTVSFNSAYYFEPNHGDATGASNRDVYCTLFKGSTKGESVITYFGGQGDDNIGNVSFFQDKIYLTGGTKSVSSTFPINCPAGFLNPYCVSTVTGGADVFISQLRLDGFTGIDEKDNNNKNFFSIYPNPSHTNINISFVDDGNYDVVVAIYDIIGKVLLTKTIKKQNRNFNKKINVSDFANGVYFIKLQVNGENYSSKFIKQ